MRKGRGEITKLSALFDKYKNTLRAPQGSVVECFRDVVADLMHIDIPAAQITYTVHSRTLSARVAGPLKSELRLHAKEILTHMKGRLGERNAPAEIV